MTTEIENEELVDEQTDQMVSLIKIIDAFKDGTLDELNEAEINQRNFMEEVNFLKKENDKWVGSVGFYYTAVGLKKYAKAWTTEEQVLFVKPKIQLLFNILDGEFKNKENPSWEWQDAINYLVTAKALYKSGRGYYITGKKFADLYKEYKQGLVEEENAIDN